MEFLVCMNSNDIEFLPQAIIILVYPMLRKGNALSATLNKVRQSLKFRGGGGYKLTGTSYNSYRFNILKQIFILQQKPYYAGRVFINSLKRRIGTMYPKIVSNSCSASSDCHIRGSEAIYAYNWTIAGCGSGVYSHFLKQMTVPLKNICISLITSKIWII